MTSRLTQVVGAVAVRFRLRVHLSRRCHAAVAIHSRPDGGRQWRPAVEPRSARQQRRRWQGQVAHGHVIQRRPVQQRTDGA